MLNKIYIIFFLLSTTFAYAQNSKDAIYMELGGTGLIYSLNYDRLLMQEEKLAISVNLGVSYIPNFFPNSDFAHIYGNSLGFSTLVGSSRHFAEIGFNASYWYMKDIDDDVYWLTFLPIRLGYRYQKKEGGLFFKTSFMPIVPIYQDADASLLYPLTPHFALGLGWSF